MMVPGRQEAVLCRQHARLEACGARFEAQRAADVSNDLIEVTQRVLVESWRKRPDEHGYGHEFGVTLIEDAYHEWPPRGLLVTGLDAVRRHLRRIFFPEVHNVS